MVGIEMVILERAEVHSTESALDRVTVPNAKIPCLWSDMPQQNFVAIVNKKLLQKIGWKKNTCCSDRQRSINPERQHIANRSG